MRVRVDTNHCLFGGAVLRARQNLVFLRRWHRCNLGSIVCEHASLSCTLRTSAPAWFRTARPCAGWHIASPGDPRIRTGEKRQRSKAGNDSVLKATLRARQTWSVLPNQRGLDVEAASPKRDPREC
jgi:hypothetical protein